ncbi:MAG: RHS repeat-associated core domain-containing protein [Thermoguttaceae bacterium]|nr:RHS repeat-associated core domain-containing protein [Thermoguttaceae bacterium]
MNHLLTLTDPVGNTTSYTYNYMGLVATETNEKNATRYYSYDALGRLVSKTDRNGRITTYTYDTIGRLTSENWSDTTNYFMYTYDAVGNLLYATDGQHSYSYTYDALNRPIYTTFNFDSQSAVFAYTYDLAGRRTSSSLSLNGHSDRVNQTTYDFLGNATSIRQTGSAVDEIFAEFDYNANGLMTSVKRYEVDGNNLINEIAESVYTYNANNAVTSITHKNPNGTQIVQHSYTYDNTNNIVEYLNSIDGSTTYNYDFLGQLIGADYANQNLDDETYTYDENGNRITANGDTYTTGDNNELTSDGTWSYTYDAEGNRISKTNATNRELYTWDHRNRLTTVTQQEWDSVEQDWTTTQIVEYAYDYNNVWIRKTIGNNKTIFIPENYQTTVQIDNGTTTHHYLWTPNQQDKLLADTTPYSTSWALTDHLGTIRDILGTTSTHLIYDAFGNLTSGTNPILFGYTGKPFDSATNLQNNINRWYDATIGRWLSTDPINFYGNTLNLYKYVQNNPIYNIDWCGLEDVPYWTSFLPLTAFDAGECLLILYIGHGTFEGGTEIINGIDLGYTTVPRAEVPKDFIQFWSDMNQYGYIHDKVFFAFIGCWPDYINTEFIPESNRMLLDEKPLKQKNGNGLLEVRDIPQRLEKLMKKVLCFTKEKIESRCCNSVTFFIVGSPEGYIPYQDKQYTVLYLTGVRCTKARTGKIKREIVK